ncbi:hypothetical protein E4K67_03295 [Desulfosporosinus fructosivorans]|uniref:Uncharacterized protein n=1 Tax=Desulfosporosinus fructosivorans TaxID=2018669 RepID=A0A4Z0RAY9_9FIRM|nr:hypothetical protein E4K67_03295 [Desulfosporosinus fructosivorans]
MSISSSTLPLNQPTHLAVIIPFKRPARTNEQFQSCIFCGKTMKIQNFKGKTVCIQCLLRIPDIFSCR